MMRRWRSEPPHYQRISKDSGARFLAGLSLLWPMILHQSKKVAAKLWKRADMLKNENITKDTTLLVTFEITCWPLDASMYLCLHLLHIINNNDTKKIQSKNIYIKRANCSYIGQTRWICWHRNRWCFTNSIATCNDNEKKSLKAIQSKDITHLKKREITTSNHTVKASRSLLFGDQMIYLPSSDDGEKVLIYTLFYMMKTNSI
jgi:hypothetical protein